MTRPIPSATLSLLLLWGLCLAAPAAADQHLAERPAAVTILCYLNGDNDLAAEVLDALDRLETVGSSEQVQVIALVDGHPDWLAPFDDQWAATRLLRVTRDDTAGEIRSTVLAEWGEADLGDPRILQRFVQTAVARFPARRYLFYAFAHGRGIINTRKLALDRPGKSLAISSDHTQASVMPMEQFRTAIETGLSGDRLELMVLFSCLTNMVEIGYGLAGLTDYLLASENEIRLVNEPAGSYQIRGLPFEKMVAALHVDPWMDLSQLGRMGVDAHLAAYEKDVRLPAQTDPATCRLSADMTLVKVEALPDLVKQLDHLAGLLIAGADDPRVVAAMAHAQANTAQMASFLNLEYYDLLGWISHLQARLPYPGMVQACQAVIDTLHQKVLVYGRRTADCSATGMSVYLSHPSVPDNIYQTHQTLYARSRFGQDTRWDEMIDRFRPRLRDKPINRHQQQGAVAD